MIVGGSKKERKDDRKRGEFIRCYELYESQLRYPTTESKFWDDILVTYKHPNIDNIVVVFWTCSTNTNEITFDIGHGVNKFLFALK